MVDSASVIIKGIKDGLLVTLGDGDWPIIQSALVESLEKKSSFFQGARMAMDVGSRVFQPNELSQLREELSTHGIFLWAVMSTNQTTEETAKDLGLATKILVPRSERDNRLLDATHESENGIFIQKTLRSGFKVSSHGHVTVMGEVRPGSEVIAGGSVIVWGRARGSIIAGADGDDKAFVCALSLEPKNLRIANYLANLPLKCISGQPVCAMIRDGKIIIDPWKAQEH